MRGVSLFKWRALPNCRHVISNIKSCRLVLKWFLQNDFCGHVRYVNGFLRVLCFNYWLIDFILISAKSTTYYGSRLPSVWTLNYFVCIHILCNSLRLQSVLSLFLIKCYSLLSITNAGSVKVNCICKSLEMPNLISFLQLIDYMCKGSLNLVVSNSICN